MFSYVARNYLYQLSVKRQNPLNAFTIFCPSFVVGDFTYLEGFLFTVEFSILVLLVVKFFSIDKTVNLQNFKIIKTKNNNPVQQNTLIFVRSNLIRVITNKRQILYYGSSYNELQNITERVLLLVFQPYNNQHWLAKVYESSFPVEVQKLANNELKNANSIDQ